MRLLTDAVVVVVACSTSMIGNKFQTNVMNCIGLALAVLLSVTGVNGAGYGDGGTDMMCWKAKTMVQCGTGFPTVSMTIDWNGADNKDNTFIEDTPFQVHASFHINQPAVNVGPFNLSSHLVKPHGFFVDHANVSIYLMYYY